MMETRFDFCGSCHTEQAFSLGPEMGLHETEGAWYWRRMGTCPACGHEQVQHYDNIGSGSVLGRPL